MASKRSKKKIATDDTGKGKSSNKKLKEDKSHIDKLFQEQLGNRSFEIPDAFLADLESKLPSNKPKSGKWLYWWSALLFSSLMALLVVFNYKSKNEVEIAHTEITNISTSMDGMENGSNRSETHFVKGESNKKTLIAQKNKNSQDNTGVELNQNKEVKHTEQLNSKGKLNQKKSNLVKSKQTRKTKNTKITKQKTEQKGEKEEVNLYNTKSKTNNSFSKNSNKKNSTVIKEYSKNTENSIEGSLANLYPIPKDTLKSKNKTPKASIVIRDSVVIRDSIVIRDSVVLKFQNSENKLKSKNKNINFEGQIFGGFMRIQPKLTSPNEEYKSVLLAGEKTSFSPTFGFNLNTYIKNWAIGTGINYYQFGEKTNYTASKTQSVFDSIQSSLDTVFYDSLGNIWTPASGVPWTTIELVTTSDSIFSTNTTTKTKVWQNTYSKMVLPLNFGYRFSYKTWALIPRVGFQFEFALANQKGIYLDAKKEEFIELDPLKFSVSSLFSVEIRKTFGDFHIFVLPKFQYQFGNLLSTQNLARKYNALGINFGIGMKL